MKQCPYCNAEIDDESKFCSECGKEFPQGNVCAHCGATVNEGDIYCEECGRNLKDGSYASADYDEKSGMDYMKILLSSLIGIVIGLVVLALVGGCWYGYNAYSEYSAAKQAREKFVADSLEKARNDSIQLANQQEKERQDAARFEEFNKKMTFKNLLNLLDHYDNVGAAQKCGLSLIYKDVDNDGEIECTDIVYGYDVEKKGKNEIIATSKYATYLRYMLDSSSGARIYTMSEDLMSKLNNQAYEYGLIKYDGSQFIPRKKLPNGTAYVDSLDWEGDYAPIYMWGLSHPDDTEKWWVCDIGIDF